MLYTSGTTAEPKGCLITHDAAIHAWTTAADRLRITPDDRVWDPLPLFHMSCLGPLIFTTAMGGTLITTTHFAPDAALEQIEQERATWLYSVFPPITMALLTDPSFGSRDLSRVRGLLNVAPPDTHAAHPGGLRGRGQRRRALRDDRDERRDHVQRVGRDPRRAGRDPRGAAPGDRGQGRRPGDGRRAAAGACRGSCSCAGGVSSAGTTATPS